MAYIDTSVLVAYYCPEPLSAAVQKVLGKLEEPAISLLVELELYSAFAMKVRSKQLSKSNATRILSVFQKHLSESCYRILPIETAEYGLARDWIGSFSSPLRAPGALHLAAAFSNDLTLLTADKDLARSGRSFGVKCKLIS